MKQNSISNLVLQFAKTKLKNKTPYFFSKELFSYVTSFKGVSAESPSRVLRQLRKQDMLDYTVINRNSAFYRIDRIRAKA